MQKIFIPIAFVLFCGLSSVTISEAFGHGVGSETLPPVLIGNRNVTLSISEVQASADPKNVNKDITIQLFETNSKMPVKDVTFFVQASKDGTILFSNTFKREQGRLDMTIITTDSGDVRFLEEKRTYGALFGGNNAEVDVIGPVFGTGGLYMFHIEILTADSYGNNLSPSVKYDPVISIPDTTTHLIHDKDYGDQEIGIITYYDQIQNFNYDTDSKSISFFMPFDWSDKNINQVSVVHEEIRIPRLFGDFLVTKYEADVNNLTITGTAITVDDYSTDDRIIHLILSRTDLQDLAKIRDNTKQGMEFTLKPSTESGFPLTGLTRNVQYKVSLRWDPPTITTGSNIKFYFKVLDPNMINQTIASVSYDFSVISNHQIIFKKSGTTIDSQREENMVEVSIPDETGPISIVFENLGGNSFAGVEFSSVVTKPIISNLKFPIQLSSFSVQGDSKMPGKYEVDLTWFPSVIPIDQQAEFVFTIKDKQTSIPIPSSAYDFVILQKGKEVYRKSGIATAGGDFVDYTFSNGQDGQTILRIENINGSNEVVEIPFVVTPEFPFALPVMLIAVIFVITVYRTKSIKI
ncbi:MAG: hypothetical protein HZA82_04720 [Thaumarchaeota archaeon]|nr:hypothetical protein [Nitrososphaerota archaeon]